MSAAVSGAKRGLENCSNVFNRRDAKTFLTVKNANRERLSLYQRLSSHI